MSAESYDAINRPRIIGIEREYGPQVLDARGNAIGVGGIYLAFQHDFLSFLNEQAQTGLAEHVRTLGYFCRAYVDVGLHPEIATVETTLEDIGGRMIGADLQLVEFYRRFLASRQDLTSESVFLPIRSTEPKGESWSGVHANFAVSSSIFDRDSGALLFKDDQHTRQLASWIALSSLVFGAGSYQTDKDGKLFLHPYERLQSFTKLLGIDTTFNRPIINTRNEPHADPSRFARLHVISLDAMLSERSTRAQLSCISALLRAFEIGRGLDTWLEDPLHSTRHLSVKPDKKVTLKDASHVTGIEALQTMVAELHAIAVQEGFPLVEIEALDTLSATVNVLLDSDDKEKKGALLLAEWMLKARIINTKDLLSSIKTSGDQAKRDANLC